MNAIVLPHRKLEDWKYSDLRGAVDAEAVSIAPTAAWSIVAAKGDLDINDLPAQIPFGEHGAMAPVATSLAKAGPSVRVPAGENAEIAFELTEAGHGRALVVVEEGASLTLIEKLPPPGFTNIASEIVIGKNASLTHLRVVPNNEAVRVSDYAITVAAGGIYRAHLADFGAKLSRTELHIALEGEGAEAHLSGVSVLGDAHADVTAHITHAAGKTQSTQTFKYVASGHARGVYQGKVTVAEGANGSDSRQTAKGLLLEDRAEIDLKPELEIFADDVKCAHGAAVGDLDAESLFYLRSRGIPEAEARALLMRAFLGDAVDQIEDETQRAAIWQAVDAALEGLS
ncbi:MAG TPA: Fe-S cluster assembly protein SufD [Rhizomicrobium sp.]|nr:Fe-S cluster assembly protein SufD [Rhizomicrobium sp.]